MSSVKFMVFCQEQFLDEFLILKPYSLKTSEVSEDRYVFYDVEAQSECSGNCEQLFKLVTVVMDGYLCSLLQSVLQNSPPYRTCLATNLCKMFRHKIPQTSNYKFIVTVKLVPPQRDILDYRGNEITELLCLERRELDIAMAWLSTLGGAFSALGDTIEKCADIAGKISIRQLQIALRLGDPLLIARCKLYMALSLIQKQKFQQAKAIVRAQYVLACCGPVIDNRLKSMCLGIWTKLKYDKKFSKSKSHIT